MARHVCIVYDKSEWNAKSIEGVYKLLPKEHTKMNRKGQIGIKTDHLT